MTIDRYDNKKIDNILNNLSKSKFRNNFKLNDREKLYINEKGIDIIRNHAYDFINKRLSNNT